MPQLRGWEWDMCQNRRYTEHGITALDGFAAERFTIASDHLVVVPRGLGEPAVLIEPTSIVAKAWEQIERIGSRTHWQPRTALIVGAGPVGLLAALLARQRGLITHVLDVVTTGPKPKLVAALENDVVFGTVNANRRHYQAAADALASADPDWLQGLITRRVSLAHWDQALLRHPEDVKVVIDFGTA